MQPWEPWPEEKSVWFERFQRYLRQNKPRSLLAIYNQECRRARKGAKKTLPGAWRAARVRFRWRERIAAYDVAEVARKEREYKHQRDQQRAREMAASQKLYEKGDALIDLPHTTQTITETKDGTGITVVHEVAAVRVFQVAAKLYAEASAQGRAALEMADKRILLRDLSNDQLADLMRKQLGKR